MTTLAIEKIEVDPTIQIRRGNREETLRRYEDAFDKLPPVDVFDTSDGLLLADGFHRIAAAIRLGKQSINAKVHKGTRQDALEHAVIANTKNADPLTSEERDDGIRRLRQIHPKETWSLRRIAEAMSVSEVTVRRVFDIDEVQQATFPDASRDAPANSHYREIARAPKEHWQPLVKATQQRGWTRDVTAQAVQNLKDDRIPKEQKRKILKGEADPVVITPEGEFAVPADVAGRRLREMTANDAQLALERALAALARLRLFRPEAIVATMGADRRRHLMAEMPGYVAFMEEIVSAAKSRKLEAVE